MSEPAPHPMDLQALRDACATLDFEEHGHLELVGADWSEESLVLHLDLWPGRRAWPDRWHLRCDRPRAHELTLGRVGHISSLDEHPLLWEYTEPVAELSFYGRPENLATLLGELWQAHWSIAAHYLPFRCRTNDFVDGYGVLFEGPARLARAYEAVLSRHRLKPSLLEVRAPRRWGGTGWVPEERGLSLLRLGGSHVVTSSIEVTRVEGVEPRDPDSEEDSP